MKILDSIPKSLVNFYEEKIIFDGNIKIFCLADGHYPENIAFDSRNERSAVLKIVNGVNHFIFTGDAPKNIETDLVNKYGDFLVSNVLKAGHHGSKTSSHKNFVSIVKPEYAIISAGAGNQFGHPDSVVVNIFESNNVELLRTDESGAIILRSDGKNLEKINWK
ncbi:MAG: hypothetical protein IAE91_11770 [Ignavibacteriaceae bacterium]|nr:hypothetical protein [Ignavibacteriaceae bacterium]